MLEKQNRDKNWKKNPLVVLVIFESVFDLLTAYLFRTVVNEYPFDSLETVHLDKLEKTDKYVEENCQITSTIRFASYASPKSAGTQIDIFRSYSSGVMLFSSWTR